jgi:glycosyltransferase involved in cell wall biosynthesis
VYPDSEPLPCGHAPAIAVILPTFNRLKFLWAAVDCVLAQTFRAWELIVADDGSDAPTLGYLQTLQSNPRIRLLELEHTGNPAAVRNATLREARSEYVAFIDSDEVWMLRKLEIQLASPRLLSEVDSFDEQQLFFEEYDLWLRLNLRSDVSAIAAPLVLVRNQDQHYSADRVGVYQAPLRLRDEFARLTGDDRLDSVLRLERAKTAGALAAVHSAAGNRAEALRMLWRSRACAWKSRPWWPKAAAAAARVIVPAWVRDVVRGRRNRQLPGSGRV